MPTDTPPPAATEQAAPSPADSAPPAATEQAAPSPTDDAAAPPPADDAAPPPPEKTRYQRVVDELEREKRAVVGIRNEVKARTRALEAREAEIRAREEKLTAWTGALEKVKDDPIALLQEVAKAAGWDEDKLYAAVTQRKLNGAAPSVEEIERRVAARIREEQAAQSRAMREAEIATFRARAPEIITQSLRNYPTLSLYTPESVAQVAIDRAIAIYQSGSPVTLDQVMQTLESEEAARAAAYLARHTASAGQPTPAASAGQPSAPTTVTNGQATASSGARRPASERDAEAELRKQLALLGYR